MARKGLAKRYGGGHAGAAGLGRNGRQVLSGVCRPTAV